METAEKGIKYNNIHTIYTSAYAHTALHRFILAYIYKHIFEWMHTPSLCSSAVGASIRLGLRMRSSRPACRASRNMAVWFKRVWYTSIGKAYGAKQGDGEAREERKEEEREDRGTVKTIFPSNRQTQGSTMCICNGLRNSRINVWALLASYGNGHLEVIHILFRKITCST